MTEQAVAERSSGFERLKAYYSRHEGRVAAACFAAGFIFDIVTAGRIDSWLTIGQQALYLLLGLLPLLDEHGPQQGAAYQVADADIDLPVPRAHFHPHEPKAILGQR